MTSPPGQRERNHAALHRPRFRPAEIADAAQQPLVERELVERDGRRIERRRLVGEHGRFGPGDRCGGRAAGGAAARGGCDVSEVDGSNVTAQVSDLSSAEGDDAADRVVGRDADGHAIAWNDLDAEAAHAAAQLREHFVAGVALHAIQPAGVDRHDRSLHVDQIVFAQ